MKIPLKMKKKICREESEIPNPRDVIMTKVVQIIIKMKTKEDTRKISEKVSDNDGIKDKIRIVLPRKIRKMILILGVDEQMVVDAVIDALDDRGRGGRSLRNIEEKLRDLDLDVRARKAFEKLLDEQRNNFKIIKKIKTRAVKINWLIDIDEDGRNMFLNRRLC